VKKPRKLKLALRSETVRELAQVELPQVAGGVQISMKVTVCFSACVSLCCPA
jgi:hypothetical protein